MKNRIKILASALALILIACGNSQKRTGDTAGTDNTTINDGTSNDTYYDRDPEVNDDITGDDNTNNDGNTLNTNSTSAQDRNLSETDYGKQRNTQLYSSLNMSKDQIQKYETANRSSMDTWRKDNPEKTMTAQDRMRIERDNLKPILDESQFQQYGQWSSSNPYRE